MEAGFFDAIKTPEPKELRGVALNVVFDTTAHNG